MMISRWIVPIVVMACLGGFVLGFAVPQCLHGCSPIPEGNRSGVAGSVTSESKPPKARLAPIAERPRLSTNVGSVQRGETLPLDIQTTSGAICALHIRDSVGEIFNFSSEFADQSGHCQVNLKVPDEAASGPAQLVICASTCLDPQVYFQIR